MSWRCLGDLLDCILILLSLIHMRLSRIYVSMFLVRFIQCRPVFDLSTIYSSDHSSNTKKEDFLAGRLGSIARLRL